jgi:hypothetical protein
VTTLGLADGGNGEQTRKTFDFYVEEECGIPEVTLWEQREGVFSYSSAHQLMEEEGGVMASGQKTAGAMFESSKATSEKRYQREVIDDGGSDLADADKATNLGSAFHELAQVMVETGKGASPERVDLIAGRWGLGKVSRKRLGEALRRWMASDLRAEVMRDWPQLRAEVPFFAQVKSRFGDYVEGAIDLLCTNPGSKDALVLDYKTGDANLTFDEIKAHHEMQARFYAYVLMQQGYEAVECAFVCVERDDGSGQPIVVRYAFDAENPPKFE